MHAYDEGNLIAYTNKLITNNQALNNKMQGTNAWSKQTRSVNKEVDEDIDDLWA